MLACAVVPTTAPLGERNKWLHRGGPINPSSMLVKTKAGAVAIGGWQAPSVQDGTTAADAKVAAAKALARAEAGLVVITRAVVLAAKVGTMSPAEIAAAVHAAFVATPEKQCARPDLEGKQQGATFLAAPPAPRAALLDPARAACPAAVAAGAATEAADVTVAAALAGHQPPAAPSVLAAGTVTAAAVDVAPSARRRRARS